MALTGFWIHHVLFCTVKRHSINRKFSGVMLAERWFVTVKEDVGLLLSFLRLCAHFLLSRSRACHVCRVDSKTRLLICRVSFFYMNRKVLVSIIVATIIFICYIGKYKCIFSYLKIDLKRPMFTMIRCCVPFTIFVSAFLFCLCFLFSGKCKTLPGIVTNYFVIHA